MLLYEAETLPGLEPFAADELRADARIAVQKPVSGGVPFTFDGAPDELNTFRTVTAIYRVMYFDVPRPKALLGHQFFTTLRAAIGGIIAGRQGFRSLSLDAAGSDSSVMIRLKTEIATAVGLNPAKDKGDLHLRVRKNRQSDGWEVLIRLTPRPLVTRAWRTVNVPGALNAATAAVMAGLTDPSEQDNVINLCCGSASLMVERSALAGFRSMVGVDYDRDVLNTASEHLRTGQVTGASLVCADVGALPFPDASFDVLMADLPFGNLVGSHQENLKMYPALLKEAARIARKSSRFALITHEKNLIGDVLKREKRWTVTRQVPLNLNGLHPEIILLRRG